jgi:hypothetical protein
MSAARFLAPFAVGLAAGAALHKYWPEIKEKGGPTFKKVVKDGSELFEKGRERFWEESEKFSDLVAEIREEEESKGKTTPPDVGPVVTPPPAPTT